MSSSLVREVARFGGDVGGLVHPRVEEALRARYAALNPARGPGDAQVSPRE